MQPDQSPLLYDCLGGIHNVATVLEDLIDQVMSGPRLDSNPVVDEAHHRVSSSGFEYPVTEMVCEAAGGSTRDGRWRRSPTPWDHRGRVGRVHARPAPALSPC